MCPRCFIVVSFNSLEQPFSGRKKFRGTGASQRTVLRAVRNERMTSHSKQSQVEFLEEGI